jgi:hypothetical protein
MSIARKAHLEGAFLGETVTIARGSSVLSIPADEIGDLYAVISELVSRRSDAAATSLLEDSIMENVRDLETPKQVRRGRLWEAVSQHLGEQGRAQGFKSLLKFVKAKGLTDRDPAHALKIALGKKVATGELIKSPSGRYTLPKPSHRVRHLNGSTTTRQRPGHLWNMLKLYLEENTEGLKLEEIISMAKEHKWTTANNVEHAIKICLGRVRDQLEQASSGQYRLAGSTTGAPAGKIIKRKKLAPTPKSSNGGNVAQPVQQSEASFIASTQYHLPRSRQPR